MTTSNNPTEDSTDREFVISRVFDAPRVLVFTAWTDPEHMAQWWGPHGFTNPVCEMDVRPGGAHRIVMRGPDGVEYPIKGVYLEVVEPERLVMTLDCSEHPAEWHDLVNPSRQKGEGNGLVAKPGTPRRRPGQGLKRENTVTAQNGDCTAACFAQ